MRNPVTIGGARNPITIGGNRNPRTILGTRNPVTIGGVRNPVTIVGGGGGDDPPPPEENVMIDALLDIETGTDEALITLAALNAAETGDAWTWTFTAHDPVSVGHTRIETGGKTYGEQTVEVDGVEVAPAGLRCIKFDHAEAVSDGLVPIWDELTAIPPETVNRLVVSGWLYFGAIRTGEGNVGLDHWKINATPYLVLQQALGEGSAPGGTAGIVRVETQRNGGVTVKSTPITIDIGWYFCELYWNGTEASGEMTLLVRDEAMDFYATSSFISNDAVDLDVSAFTMQDYLTPEGGFTLHDLVGRTWKLASFAFPLFPLTLSTPVVTLEQTAAGTITLSWPSKAVSYKIERSANGGSSWTTLETSIHTFDLANAVPGENTYEATGLTDNTAYRFRVTAIVGDVQSAGGSSSDLTIDDSPFSGAWQDTIAPGSTNTDSQLGDDVTLLAKHTLTAAGTGSRLRVYNVNIGVAGNVKLALYNNSSPKVLLGSATVAIVDGANYTEVDLESIVPGLTNGQVIWIGFHAQITNALVARYLDGGASNTAYRFESYATFPTATFTDEGTLTRTYAASIYVFTP